MPLKAREVEAIFRSRGDGAAAMYCLQMLADEQAQLRQQLMECANAINSFADLVVTAVAEVDGSLPPGKRKHLGQVMESMMGRNIDAPDINPHDKHGDVGVNTNPDQTRDEDA